MDLKKLYGDITARELASLRNDDLQAEIDQNKDSSASPFPSRKYRLVLTKKERGATFLSPTLLVPARRSQSSINQSPLRESHPHFAQKAAESIAQRSNAQFTIRDLNAVSVEGWKNGNNEFHHYSEMTKRRVTPTLLYRQDHRWNHEGPNYLAEA